MSLTLTLADRLELHLLYEWLRHDAGIAGATTASLGTSGRASGEQSALDVIDVILKDGTAIGALAVSIATWRRSRRRPITVTFRRGDDEIAVESADPETLAKVIRALSPDIATPDTGGNEGRTGSRPTHPAPRQ